MPTHTYMSPEQPMNAAFGTVPGIRAERINAAAPRRAGRPLSLARLGEIGLVVFTAAAGVWCLYEAWIYLAH